MTTSPVGTTTPSGAYSGSKSVLGLTINVNVNVNDGSTMDFHLDAGGQVTIDCKAEKYAYDGASSITLPDVDVSALGQDNVRRRLPTFDYVTGKFSVSPV